MNKIHVSVQMSNVMNRQSEVLHANAYGEKAGEPYQLDEVDFRPRPCGKYHNAQQC